MASNADTHHQQERENAEPEEVRRPMPWIVGAATAGMVLYGAIYILTASPFGNPGYGDRRSLAELRGAAPAAGGKADGKQIFTANCVACHQATGKGLPGVFPPLDGSEWADGDPRVVVNILLHGITGEIEVEGTTYKGAMPAFGHLTDAELAAVATYVRSSWSNKGGAIKAELFEQERKAGAARTTPFEGGAALKKLAAEKPS
ncbi:MAG: cytochrome c [Burkholderiaceae bacterium]